MADKKTSLNKESSGTVRVPSNVIDIFIQGVRGVSTVAHYLHYLQVKMTDLNQKDWYHNQLLFAAVIALQAESVEQLLP